MHQLVTQMDASLQWHPIQTSNITVTTTTLVRWLLFQENRPHQNQENRNIPSFSIARDHGVSAASGWPYANHLHLATQIPTLEMTRNWPLHSHSHAVNSYSSPFQIQVLFPFHGIPTALFPFHPFPNRNDKTIKCKCKQSSVEQQKNSSTEKWASITEK